MNPALLVLNPREIPECVAAIESLGLPKCWLSYMNEQRAASYANVTIRSTDYSHYVVVSDDTKPTNMVLDLVLERAESHPVVTGYCGLDQNENRDIVNLTTNDLPPEPPKPASYHFMSRSEADSYWDNVIPTTFVGLALTCMTREMWLKYPLQVGPYGGQMDYNLSLRLARDQVPMVAAVGAYMEHVKERWNRRDRSPEKRLLVGERKPEVRWTNAEVPA